VLEGSCSIDAEEHLVAEVAALVEPVLSPEEGRLLALRRLPTLEAPSLACLEEESLSVVSPV